MQLYFIVSNSDDLKSKRLLKSTFKSCRKHISREIYFTRHEMTDLTIHQRSQFSAQSSQFWLLISIESSISRSSRRDFMNYTYHELTVIFGNLIGSHIAR